MSRNYVVGNDRVLVHTDSPLLEGWEPCTSVKQLQAFAGKVPDSIIAGMRWKGSKFPADLMKQVLGTIHEFKDMETAYSLYYRILDHTWKINVPKQAGGSQHVHYEDAATEIEGEYYYIGSIHTHPEISAFWSGTDLTDQQKHHGIHIVFSLHDGLVEDYKLSIFTPTGVYDKKFEDIFEPVDFHTVYPSVDAWVEKIKKQELRVVESTFVNVRDYERPAFQDYRPSGRFLVDGAGTCRRTWADFEDDFEKEFTKDKKNIPEIEFKKDKEVLPKGVKQTLNNIKCGIHRLLDRGYDELLTKTIGDALGIDPRLIGIMSTKTCQIKEEEDMHAGLAAFFDTLDEWVTDDIEAVGSSEVLDSVNSLGWQLTKDHMDELGIETEDDGSAK